MLLAVWKSREEGSTFPGFDFRGASLQGGLAGAIILFPDDWHRPPCGSPCGIASIAVRLRQKPRIIGHRVARSELLWLKSSRSWAPPIGLDWICRANQAAMRKNVKVQTAQQEKSKEKPRFVFTVIPYSCLFDSAISTPLLKVDIRLAWLRHTAAHCLSYRSRIGKERNKKQKNLLRPVQPSARPAFRSRQGHDLTPSSLFYLVQFRTGSFPSQVSLYLPTSSSSQPEKEGNGHLFLAGARAPRSPKRRKERRKRDQRQPCCRKNLSRPSAGPL